MRPRSQWEKDTAKKAPAKRKTSAKRKKNPVTEGVSEANLQSETDLPREGVTLKMPHIEDDQRGEDEGTTHNFPPPKRIRARSADKNNPAVDRQEPWDTAAAAALRRAI